MRRVAPLLLAAPLLILGCAPEPDAAPTAPGTTDTPVASGPAAATPAAPAVPAPLLGPGHSPRISADGRWAVVTGNGEVRLFDLAARKRVDLPTFREEDAAGWNHRRGWREDPARVQGTDAAAGFAPDGRRLAALAEIGGRVHARVWDLPTDGPPAAPPKLVPVGTRYLGGKPKWAMQAPRAATFLPDGRLLVNDGSRAE